MYTQILERFESQQSTVVKDRVEKKRNQHTQISKVMENHRTADSTKDYETHHNEFSEHKNLYPWIKDSRDEFKHVPLQKLYGHRQEKEAELIANLEMNVLPDFELPSPGEGVQTRASDFIMREFSNERLFQELSAGSYE